MDNSEYVITKPSKKEYVDDIGKFQQKTIFIILIIFIIVISVIFCFTKQSEGFDNDNLSEQRMFQEMTDENKTIYLELSDDGKINMFNTWKKIKKL